MTHYQTLELPETASATDIRSAYRRLVLATHPDRTPDPAAHGNHFPVGGDTMIDIVNRKNVDGTHAAGAVAVG